ncbi:MAG: DUF4364 family protein [Christensenellaceae bacterium]|jgi:hypothetical protein|nr:DUF4364 family protein [Christensenellaceae bacterium]
MSFFSDGVTRSKLTVLYFLHRLDVELTRDQLSTVGMQYNLAPYFDLQSAVYELEEGGFVAAVPRPFGQGYRITPRGREALDMFLDRLPLSLREELDDNADACREEIRRQTQYSAAIEKLPQGGYRVTFRTLERDADILTLALVFPDAHSANHAAGAWAAHTEEIYRYLLDTLLGEHVSTEE